MIFWSKLNDLDVKFKIYYKYENARFEHKSGLLLRVTLHNQRFNLQGQGTVLLAMHFEITLKHAQTLGYEIQDILYGNAWFEQECESFDGLWVSLAFYDLSRVGHSWIELKTSVSIYKSWMISYIL